MKEKQQRDKRKIECRMKYLNKERTKEYKWKRQKKNNEKKERKIRNIDTKEINK